MTYRNSRCAAKLTREKLSRFLATRQISQARFAEWLGVSTRTFQTWMATEIFPRMLEIILTQEPPPIRAAVASKLGRLIGEYSEADAQQPTAAPASEQERTVGKMLGEFRNQTEVDVR